MVDQLRPWTMDDEAKLEHGSIARSLTGESSWLAEQYPALAAVVIPMIREACALTGGTSWYTALGEIPNKSFLRRILSDAERHGDTERVAGKIRLRADHLRALDDAFAGRFRAPSRRQRKQVSLAAWAALHEILHTLGHPDRGVYLIEFLEDVKYAEQNPEIERVICEGGTQLATAILLPDWVSRVGLDELVPGLTTKHEDLPNHVRGIYDAEMKTLNAGIRQVLGEPFATNSAVDRVIVRHVAEGATENSLTRAVTTERGLGVA
jgi:hypothetical protein